MPIDEDLCGSLIKNQTHAVAIQAGALRENPTSGPDGVGVQEGIAYTLEARAEVQAVAFDTTQITSAANYSNPQPGDPCHPLAAGAHPPAVAMNLRGREGGAMPELDDVASLRAASGGSSRSYVAAMQVRRLTPRECERLQGFPDDYTLVPHRGKPAADGPRYKALGNSMAVPCMRWLGERIAMVDAINKERLRNDEREFRSKSDERLIAPFNAVTIK
jgi:DNA (cytosine-5)-methyltransferase 1